MKKCPGGISPYNQKKKKIYIYKKLEHIFSIKMMELFFFILGLFFFTPNMNESQVTLIDIIMSSEYYFTNIIIIEFQYIEYAYNCTLQMNFLMGIMFNAV